MGINDLKESLTALGYHRKIGLLDFVLFFFILTRQDVESPWRQILGHL